MAGQPQREDFLTAVVDPLQRRIARLEAANRIMAPGSMLGIQRDYGETNSFLNIVAGGYFSATSVRQLSLAFTPTVDCWWEVRGQVGMLYKVDAAYHYGVAYLELSVADADGDSSGSFSNLTQHNGVITYAAHRTERVWKLVAGQAYTCRMRGSFSGGTWQYYAGRGYVSLVGKAWSR